MVRSNVAHDEIKSLFGKLTLLIQILQRLQSYKKTIKFYHNPAFFRRKMIIFAFMYKKLFLYPANDQEHERYNKLLCGYMSFGRLAGTALEFVFMKRAKR